MNNADWWAKKLGTPQVPQGRPDNAVPMPPSQQPMQVMPQFQNTSNPATAASQAQYAVATDTCPECRSSNYFSPNAQIAKRCYDCGFPVQQSGSRYGSLTGAHVEGATQAARGNDTTNNYNPQRIIGKA